MTIAPRDEIESLRSTLSSVGATSPAFQRTLSRLTALADDHADAALLLGHVYLQNPARDPGATLAHAAYSKSALLGDTSAVERLADIELSGRMEGDHDAVAVGRYRTLANMGFPLAQCDYALLLDSGIASDAGDCSTQWYFRAAIQGSTLGFYVSGLRLWSGVGTAPDPDSALAWMSLADLRGFPLASRRLAQWRAARPDAWSDAERVAETYKSSIRALGKSASTLASEDGAPDVAKNLRELVDQSLAALRLQPSPDRRAPHQPPRANNVCDEPRVISVKHFASDAECAHVADAARDRFVATADAHRQVSSAVEVDAFHGAAALFPQTVYTPVLRLLQRRFAEFLDVSVKRFEPVSVLRYGPGHEYSEHVDYFDSRRMARHRESGDSGGQRLATCLIYLRVPEQGGETRYPASGVSVSGEPGLGLVHYNVDRDDRPDPASRHIGMRIDNGEKWLARTALRERELY